MGHEGCGGGSCLLPLMRPCDDNIFMTGKRANHVGREVMRRSLDFVRVLSLEKYPRQTFTTLHAAQKAHQDIVCHLLGWMPLFARQVM